MTRHRPAVVAALSLCAVLLTACGSGASTDTSSSPLSSESSSTPIPDTSSSSAPTPDDTGAPVPAPTANTAGEKAFVDYLKQAGAITDKNSEANLLAIGRTVCSGFDSNSTPDMIYSAMLDAKYTEEQAAILITLSVRYICPKYESLLPTESASPSPSAS